MRSLLRNGKHKEIKRHNRKPVAYKVKKEHVKFILEELKNNKTITLEEILTKLKNKYKDVDLSLMYAHRIVKDNNITLKITRIRHEHVKRFWKEVLVKI